MARKNSSAIWLPFAASLLVCFTACEQYGKSMPNTTSPANASVGPSTTDSDTEVLSPAFMIVESDPGRPPYHFPATPLFVLYRNGTVIWLDKNRLDKNRLDEQPDVQHYLSVRLSKQEQDALLKTLLAEDVWNSPKHYDLTFGAWDTPQLGVFFWDGKRRHTVWLDGWNWQWSLIPKPAPGAVVDGAVFAELQTFTRASSHLPNQLRNALEIAFDFEHKEATEWSPDAIELMLLPCSTASSPAGWPPELPPAGNLHFREPPVGQYSREVRGIFRIHSRYLPVVREQTHGGRLLRITEDHAVTFRLPLPGEQSWRSTVQ